jgi:hypothetical protein
MDVQPSYSFQKQILRAFFKTRLSSMHSQREKGLKTTYTIHEIADRIYLFFLSYNIMDVMIEITFNSQSPPNTLTDTSFQEQATETPRGKYHIGCNPLVKYINSLLS